MDFTNSVLANPGAPVIRQCPPAKRAMRICSITSCWPTMTLANSASIRVLPVDKRSTISASFAAGKGVGVSVDSVVRLIRVDSVSHSVKNHINGERVSDLFGKVLEVEMVVTFPLPSIAVVGVVRGKTHDAPLIVKDDPMMHDAAAFFRGVMIR